MAMHYVACLMLDIMTQHSYFFTEAKGASVKSLGQTISGREIDCITVGMVNPWLNSMLRAY